MLFNSLQFLIFFPVVVMLYFATPQNFRWLLLLVASYYFYVSLEPIYGLLIFTSTLVDYFAARWLDHVEDKYRRYVLAGSLITNLGLLFIFKYLGFFLENLNTFFEAVRIDYQSPVLHLLLPVGISFYTFQSLSYTIDVYRRVRPAEKHFGIFALYVSFFPQLVAGPIETSRSLLPQFHAQRSVTRSKIVTGLQLMLWGFFKKLVIADNCARIVDSIYSHHTEAHGLALLAATVLFAIQIYTDFSGYSDIARGSARIMGYDLMLNFRQPYFAKSVQEFWNRWHISLMKWFREYIYIPLGGSRVSTGRLYVNILTVFLISGIWHGAAWTFIAWGLLNALFIICERQFKKISTLFKSPYAATTNTFSFFKIFGTFLLILLTWVFFRSDTIHDAVSVLKSIYIDLTRLIILPLDTSADFILLTRPLITLSTTELLGLAGGILILFIADIVLEFEKKQFLLNKIGKFGRIAVYYALIIYIVLFGYFGEASFLYFQF